MMTTLYTPAEVARHNHAQDLWLIIHGGVYNITTFLQQHPGGEEVLLELGGTDATVCFESIGHTDDAMQLRKTFKIGEIAENGRSEVVDAPMKSRSTNGQPKEEQPRQQETIHKATVKRKMGSTSYLPMIVNVLAVASPYIIAKIVRLLVSYFWPSEA